MPVHPSIATTRISQEAFKSLAREVMRHVFEILDTGWLRDSRGCSSGPAFDFATGSVRTSAAISSFTPHLLPLPSPGLAVKGAGKRWEVKDGRQNSLQRGTGDCPWQNVTPVFPSTPMPVHPSIATTRISQEAFKSLAREVMRHVFVILDTGWLRDSRGCSSGPAFDFATGSVRTSAAISSFTPHLLPLPSPGLAVKGAGKRWEVKDGRQNSLQRGTGDCPWQNVTPVFPSTPMPVHPSIATTRISQEAFKSLAREVMRHVFEILDTGWLRDSRGCSSGPAFDFATGSVRTSAAISSFTPHLLPLPSPGLAVKGAGKRWGGKRWPTEFPAARGPAQFFDR
jgi:hypothetical protein